MLHTPFCYPAWKGSEVEEPLQVQDWPIRPPSYATASTNVLKFSPPFFCCFWIEQHLLPLQLHQFHQWSGNWAFHWLPAQTSSGLQLQFVFWRRLDFGHHWGRKNSEVRKVEYGTLVCLLAVYLSKYLANSSVGKRAERKCFLCQLTWHSSPPRCNQRVLQWHVPMWFCPNQVGHITTQPTDSRRQ